MKEYSLECPDCGISWAGASDREMVDMMGIDECQHCDVELEVVVEEV